MRSLRFFLLATAIAVSGCAPEPAPSGPPQVATSSTPGLSSTVMSLAINQLWPMAEAELNAYAQAHPATALGQAITKGLPAVSAEYKMFSAAVAPRTLAQFIAAANTFIQALPPGTIGVADLAHVQTIAGLVNAAASSGLISSRQPSRDRAETALLTSN